VVRARGHRIDRRLPKPLRTFAALYGSWLKKRPRREPEHASHVRPDAPHDADRLALVLGILTGASCENESTE